MKRLFCLFLILLIPACAFAKTLPMYDYQWQGTSKVWSYESNHLIISVEKGKIGETVCYFSKIWMDDPGKQIVKATAPWETSLELPSEIALRLEKPVLALNGSGFVSPTFPEIPENYPGSSPDYYYTPLGSITVTDGKVYRSLQGVPFYGLSLQEDGLHLHVGEDNTSILAKNPSQTWSFYEGCPLIENHKCILDTEWFFATMRASRNILIKMDKHNYVNIMATSTNGLALTDAVAFIQEYFDPVWAYNLDGGSSVALLAQRNRSKKMEVIYGNRVRVTDIMAFTDLTD